MLLARTVPTCPLSWTLLASVLACPPNVRSNLTSIIQTLRKCVVQCAAIGQLRLVARAREEDKSKVGPGHAMTPGE